MQRHLESTDVHNAHKRREHGQIMTFAECTREVYGRIHNELCLGVNSLADHGNQDYWQTLQEQSQRISQREHLAGFVPQRGHATHRSGGREFSGFYVNCKEKRDGWNES